MKKEHNFYAVALAILGAEIQITPPPGHRLVKAQWPAKGFTFEPIPTDAIDDADTEEGTHGISIPVARADRAG